MGPRRPARPPGGWHAFRHHTSELGLQLGAPDPSSLFAEAGEALGELLREECPVTEEARDRTLRVEARDSEALLVAWLNELVFLGETELWAPDSVEVLEVSSTLLRARCRGRRLGAAPARIKAATYHGLEIRRQDSQLVAEVILDV